MERIFKCAGIVLFTELAAAGIFPACNFTGWPDPGPEPANRSDTIYSKSERTAIPFALGSDMQQTCVVLREIRNPLAQIYFSVEADALLPGLEFSFLRLSSIR